MARKTKLSLNFTVAIEETVYFSFYLMKSHSISTVFLAHSLNLMRFARFSFYPSHVQLKYQILFQIWLFSVEQTANIDNCGIQQPSNNLSFKNAFDCFPKNRFGREKNRSFFIEWISFSIFCVFHKSESYFSRSYWNRFTLDVMLWND